MKYHICVCLYLHTHCITELHDLVPKFSTLTPSLRLHLHRPLHRCLDGGSQFRKEKDRNSRFYRTQDFTKNLEKKDLEWYFSKPQSFL